MTLSERFRVKSRKDDHSGCLVWTGAKNAKGYGRFLVGGKNRYAHHIAWELSFGPVPAGLFVLHHCDNPSCVNPEHLFVGTIADNTRDMLAKGRGVWAHGEKHSKAKLTLANVIVIRHSAHTSTELARRFGVTRKAIAFIREGTNWRRN